MRVPADLGRPAGLAVDRNGWLWSTHSDGWQASLYRPDGELVKRIPLPAPIANGCGFGGPNLDRLYITTGRDRLSSRRLAMAPLSGSLFSFLPETGGVAANLFRPF